MSALRCPQCHHRIHPQDPTCGFCGFRFRYDRFERVLPFLRRPERRWKGRLSLRQRLWSTLAIPSVAFWDIARDPDYRGAFLIFFGNILVLSFYYLLIILKIPGATSLIFGYIGAFLLSTLLLGIWNFIFYGIIHMIVRFSGREASFADTFVLGQYSALPLLLANLVSLGILVIFLPLVSVTNLMHLTYPYQPIWLVWWALTAIATLWGAVLLAIGLRERYHVSTSLALLITFTVSGIVVLLGLLARFSFPLT